MSAIARVSTPAPVSVADATPKHASSRRVAYLDGLRGVAALTVLGNHLAIVFFPGAGFGYSMPGQPAIQYWFATTPFVDLILSGNFAVCVFYCLSAMALASKPMRTSDIDARSGTVLSGVLRRAPRLAIPSMVANLLACIALAFYAGPGASLLAVGSPRTAWFGQWAATPPNFLQAAHDGLVGVFTLGSTGFDVPLWTMHSELQGSLLVFLVLLAPWRALRLVLYPVLAVLLWQQYLLAFVLGLVVCEGWTALRGRSVPRLLRWLSYALVAPLGVYGLLLGSIPTTTLAPMPFYRALIPQAWLPDAQFVQVGHILGAALVLVAVVTLPVLRWLLGSRVGHFLGRISFGFYLLHFPVLMTVGIASSMWLQGLLGYLPFHPVSAIHAAFGAAVITFGMSLFVAWLFTILVDDPTVALLGRLVAMGRAWIVRTMRALRNLLGQRALPVER